MPIAFMSVGFTFETASIFFVALTTFSHHVSGFCSAQPGFTAIMSSSVSGDVDEVITLPVSASSNVALTDELPIS
jgi:hypothetical protein